MTDIQWSVAARTDLLDVVDYISDDNPEAALEVLEDIKPKTGQL